MKDLQDEIFAEIDLENPCSWREDPENSKLNVGVLPAYEKAPRAKHNNGSQKKSELLSPSTRISQGCDTKDTMECDVRMGSDMFSFVQG